MEKSSEKFKISHVDCAKVLEELARDRVSSSNTIAERMVNCAIELFGRKDYTLLIERVMNGQSSMAVVLNVGERILKAKDMNALIGLREEFLEAESRCVEKAAKRFAGLKDIATISYSKTVLSTLERIKPDKVFVSVSHPAKEGEALAEKLMEIGIEPVLFEDAAYSLVMDKVDVVIMGADAVFDKFVVNKIGSFPLALLSRHFKKDVYVLANRFKFLNRELEKAYKIREMGAEEVSSLGCEVLNYYFEKIPIGLITEIISGD